MIESCTDPVAAYTVTLFVGALSKMYPSLCVRRMAPRYPTAYGGVSTDASVVVLVLLSPVATGVRPAKRAVVPPSESSAITPLARLPLAAAGREVVKYRSRWEVERRRAAAAALLSSAGGVMTAKPPEVIQLYASNSPAWFSMTPSSCVGVANRLRITRLVPAATAARKVRVSGMLPMVPGLRI